jgi:hypothetical protein
MKFIGRYLLLTQEETKHDALCKQGITGQDGARMLTDM